jgi:glycosyltransferase involved in cell wall biosynthesis
MPSICVYGTVYNNVHVVEKSITSVWRPGYEIIIVDNYSTDGTWERLLNLRKEYNLKVYRYRCSRGLGRHIALYKCPEGSITTWFDLDTVYTPAFHKAIEYAVETGKVIHVGPLIARREAILGKGGWRDLNCGEDYEIVSRIGFNVHIPVVVGFNEPIPVTMYVREKRYGGLRRYVKTSLDASRGLALSAWRLLVTRSKTGTIFHIPGLLMGFYRNRKPDNVTWVEKAMLARAILPREAGIEDKYFHIKASLPLIKIVKGGEQAIDERVRSLVTGDVHKFYLNSWNIRILYYKNPEFLDKTFMPLVKHATLLKS